MNKPSVSSETLQHIEPLIALEFSAEQREMMLLDLEVQLARCAAMRELAIANSVAPAEVFDPRLPGFDMPATAAVRFSQVAPPPLPDNEADIAFASLTTLAAWLRTRALSSVDLTNIYLARLQRLGPALDCVVTLTADLAREQAHAADAEIKAGNYRGALHGVPWGAKDLFDTAGIATTWGAAPYKDRIATTDAAVVRRLAEAGAVLVAKTTLGALAQGDVWFGGRTCTPWNVKEGSGGSSAGSAAAVSAGLCGFAIGTETLGSIVSPSMRCGTTGLRPTFGRVSRAGAMALCWSLDKAGPICRTVEDTALVLDALNGYDVDDAGSISAPFAFDSERSIAGLRIAYDPAWFDDERADPLDMKVIEMLRDAGVHTVELKLAKLPYDSLWLILAVEAAAAFDELTVSGRAALMKRQDHFAWPNLFRKARLVPAVDFVNAQRLRRMVMQEMARAYADVDAIVGPSFAGPMQLITNLTGHPALTLRTGIVERGSRAGIAQIGLLGNMRADNDVPTHAVPHGITLWGRLFDEGRLLNLGMAIERDFDVWHLRPPQ
jgi:Asp-tRNA(Asn)/Glu-tRNA(Gln) amidotransferase A subunit family amidase